MALNSSIPAPRGQASGPQILAPSESTDDDNFIQGGKLAPQLADQLADWVRAHLVNRSDAYGGYRDVNGKTVPTTRKIPLTPHAIAQHFMADVPGDVIGLHAIGRGETGACVSRWVAVDIDAHGDDDDDPMANARFAHEVHDRARALGFSPLLLDSNGKGGYHVWVLFDRPIPSERAYSFAAWLARDQAERGLKVETFPKQSETDDSRPFGSWVRLVGGRHHKRDHWVKVWADDEWREGEEAARIILATQGGSPDLIPAEALEFKVKPLATNVPKPFKGSVDLQGDEALAADALKHLNHMVDDYDDWMRVGFALHKLGQAGLALWDSWSQGSPKYQPGACASKWETADDQGLTLGSLFHWAAERGWKNPQGRHRLKLVSPPAEPRPVAGLAEQDGAPVATRQRDKAEIEISADRARVLKETLAVIKNVAKDGRAGLFTRGDVLVRIVTETEADARLDGGVTLRNARGTARVVPVGRSWLSCWLTEYIQFFEWRKDRAGEPAAKDAHPPQWLTDAIIEGAEYPGVPSLRGVAEIPFPRPDGSIVTMPGYDRATRVLLSLSIKGDVPDAPTQDDARQAAARLLAVVDQFPFESDSDKAVWLASLLTIMGRHAIEGACPGFALIANVAGSGKGLLVDAAGIIATGRNVPCSNYPRDDAEAAKVKTAHALAATSVLHLDNLQEGGMYGGAAIDSALTSLEVNERILGQSQTTGPIELRAVWILSGNNIGPFKDAHRRWMPCNLRSNLERPEERGDLKIADLRSHLRANRAGLVRNALTILRAHALADRPSGGWAPLGSFEAWDKVVRGAVWFATGWDCNATRRKAAEESPERQDKLRLLRAWAELPSGSTKGHTVAYAMSQAVEKDGGSACPALTAAAAAFGKDGKPPTARILGNRIRAMAEQRIAGMWFAKAGDARDGVIWVVKVDTESPDYHSGGQDRDSACDSGDSSDSDSRYPASDLQTVQHVTQKLKTYGLGPKTDSRESSESQTRGPCEICWKADCLGCVPADDAPRRPGGTPAPGREASKERVVSAESCTDRVPVDEELREALSMFSRASNGKAPRIWRGTYHQA